MSTAIPNPAAPGKSTVSTASSGFTPESDAQKIRELVAAWVRASQASDADALDQLIDPDILFHRAGMEPFGREAFLDHVRRGAGHVKIEVQSDVIEVQISGDLAFARTKLEVHVTPEGKETMHRSGYALGVYRRDPDGHWRLWRDANLT
jgi:uncharacterized protein (TIGR02246 family)